MHCIEEESPRRRVLGRLATAVAVTALAAGCASGPPAAAPAPPPGARPAPAAAPAARPAHSPAPTPAAAATTAPAPAAAPPSSKLDLGPAVAQPPAPVARNMAEFKKIAARRMVAGSPRASYMGKPQPMLFGIPILEIELNNDGSVRNISVLRQPANVLAADTTDIAMEAVRRGAPYGDMSKLPKPVKWTEVFLFNDQRQFKPRTLD